jgi:hypothetical protein
MELFVKERDYYKDPYVNGILILKWIFKEEDGRMLTGFIWLRTGTMVASLEHSNKHSGSIKFWEFHECLSNYWLVKKDSVPWS